MILNKISAVNFWRRTFSTLPTNLYHKIDLKFIRFHRKRNLCPRLGLISNNDAMFIDFTQSCTLPHSLHDIWDKPSLMENIKYELPHLEQESVSRHINLIKPIKASKIIFVENNCIPCGQWQNKFPTIRNILPSAIINCASHILLPKRAITVKCLPCIGLIIGKDAISVTVESALDHVFGYIPFLNIKIQDIKSGGRDPMVQCGVFEDFFAIGQSITHFSLVKSPYELKPYFHVNGNSFSCKPSAQETFKAANIIEFVTSHIALLAGDVLAIPQSIEKCAHGQAVIRNGDYIAYDLQSAGRLSYKVVAWMNNINHKWMCSLT